MPGLFAKLADASIAFSFDSTGFERHAANFVAGELDVDLSGRVMLISGANSGLGFATTRALAARGAEVHMLCRSRERGQAARSDILAEHPEAQLELHVVDLGEGASIAAFSQAWVGPVDVLCHNAGLLPATREQTREGFELCYAVHLLGPLRLTEALLPNLRASTDARVITVSSGGMYTSSLELEGLRSEGSERYDGVQAYARTKRAQVVLSELWQARYGGSKLRFHAMHPGWAATPGVERSLPGFAARLGERLRSSEQGADTIVWLAASARAGQVEGGQFWFDRAPRSAHLLPWTRLGDRHRAALERQLYADAGVRDAVGAGSG